MVWQERIDNPGLFSGLNILARIKGSRKKGNGGRQRIKRREPERNRGHKKKKLKRNPR